MKRGSGLPLSPPIYRERRRRKNRDGYVRHTHTQGRQAVEGRGGENPAGRSGATGDRPQAREAATPRPPVKTSPGIGPGMGVGVGTGASMAYHAAFRTRT